MWKQLQSYAYRKIRYLLTNRIGMIKMAKGDKYLDYLDKTLEWVAKPWSALLGRFSRQNGRFWTHHMASSSRLLGADSQGRVCLLPRTCQWTWRAHCSCVRRWRLKWHTWAPFKIIFVSSVWRNIRVNWWILENWKFVSSYVECIWTGF